MRGMADIKEFANRAVQIVNQIGMDTRRRMAAALGSQFGGERNLYDALGYKKSPDFSDYRLFYDRSELAGRLVDLPAEDTWRRPPVIIDGESRSDEADNQTAFIEQFTRLEDNFRLWHYFKRADRLAGIGHYSVLVLGAPGESDSDLKKSTTQLLYLMPYDEGVATVVKTVEDTANKRFGLPEMYELDFGSGKKRRFHWTRILHIADNKLDSEVNGVPRLQRVLNRLFDFEKVVGGSSEAAWITAFKGMAFVTQDDYEFPSVTTDGKDQQDHLIEEIKEFVNGYRRFMRLQGVDVKELGSDTVPDPKGLVGVIYEALSAGSGIPTRIMIGSERGELASSQDQSTWAGFIASRQTTYAEPEMLRPFIQWCIDHGVLPAPSSGEWSVEWPSLFELSELEKAELAQKVGDAMYKASAGLPDLIMPPEEFANRYLDYQAAKNPDEVEFDTQPGAEEEPDEE